MEIFKIPSCWPSTSINGIHISDMLSKDNLVEDKEMTLNPIKLDPILLDFIFQICLGNSSRETAHCAIYIFEKFLSKIKNINTYDLQLLAMASIFSASKMYDILPLNLSVLHKFSAYSYNNHQILEMEKKLMSVIEYDLFVRDNLIVDRVGLFLESIRYLVDEKDYEKFCSLCFNITNLVFENISILKENGLQLSACSIIQAGLLISTKKDGKLPITIKCILIIYKVSVIAQVKVEDILAISKKIVKHCLGKEIYKKFTF